MVRYLKILNALILLLSFSALTSCNNRDTLTSVSYSDNKTFNKKGYTKDSPLRPLGNLVDDKDMKKEDITFYENYVDSGYYTLEENDKYFIWLNTERKKRLERGEKNDFKRETMPGINTYYIERSRTFKGNNISVSERRYIDTIIKLDEAKKYAKYKEESDIKIEDEISDYNILNYRGEKNKTLTIEASDYEE